MAKTARKSAIPAITEEQAAFVKRETGYELGDPCPATNMLLVQLVGEGCAARERRGNRGNGLPERDARIVELYNEYRQIPAYDKPKKLYWRIIEQLEVEKFHLKKDGTPSKKSGVTYENLTDSILPRLREAKLIV